MIHTPEVFWCPNPTNEPVIFQVIRPRDPDNTYDPVVLELLNTRRHNVVAPTLPSTSPGITLQQLSTTVPLEEPILVNSKQYVRINKRRDRKARKKGFGALKKEVLLSFSTIEISYSCQQKTCKSVRQLQAENQKRSKSGTFSGIEECVTEIKAEPNSEQINSKRQIRESTLFASSLYSSSCT